MIYGQVFIIWGHGWLGCPHQVRPLSIRQEHQLLLPGQLVAKAELTSQSWWAWPDLNWFPERQVSVCAGLAHATASRLAGSKPFHCAILKLRSTTTPTEPQTSTSSWFNHNLDRPLKITELTLLVQTSASPSIRGLNALETNSPSYLKTSLQHGPLPQQQLQQGKNYFHFDDLLMGS